jgi:ABC-type polysaccharide/polyol phosphate transport system ATPase subunit
VAEPAGVSPDQSEPLVRISNLGKEYVKYEDTPILLSSLLRSVRSKTRRSRLWAVRNVSLDVERGGSLGVLGRNGSGKSTMLRMLAGVTAPSEGWLEVRGRVAPLISVGVGFHQELTGRENVYVNGTILGLTRREIDERFDEIVDFAEIGDFLDTPVKFYSSGMFVRLGFSVAVASSPDLLLVDEVLAVGDMGFQVKCYTRMRELQEGGATIIVVSHNLSAVRNLCPRVLLLNDGQPAFLGPTDEAISIFHELIARASTTGGELDGAPPVEVVDFALVDKGGTRSSHVESGEPVTFTVRVRFNVPVEQPAFSILIVSESGMPLYSDTNWQFIGDRAHYEPGQELSCDIRLPLSLARGSFTAFAGMQWDEDPNKRLSTSPLVFYVSGRELVNGIVDLGASFEVHEGATEGNDTVDGQVRLPPSSENERPPAYGSDGEGADLGNVGGEGQGEDSEPPRFPGS